MADYLDREDQVGAFLEHLMHRERERETLENTLLGEIVELAKREGYEFTAEEFKRAVKVKIRYRVFYIKWPPGRH